MVEEREGVCFSSTELSGEVEDGRGLCAFTGEAAYHFGGKAGKIFSEVGSFKKLFWVEIILACLPVPDQIQVDCEFRCIERPSFFEIITRSDDFIPRFQCHSPTPSRYNVFSSHIRIS